MTTTTFETITTVEVPVEALVKEMGAKRAIQFIREMRQHYSDSIVEIRKGIKVLSLEKIEAEYSKKEPTRMI